MRLLVMTEADAGVLGLLLAFAAIYATGWWRWRQRSFLTARHVVAFVAGWLTLVAALLPPLAAMGESLFTFHMLQHLLLVLGAAPLLILSRMPSVTLQGLPFRRPILALRPLRAGWRVLKRLLRPLPVWLGATANFCLWHLPAAQAAANRNETLHIAEHLSLFVTALAFWWLALAEPRRRGTHYGTRLMMVASAAVVSALPGALMVLSQRALYGISAADAARWGLTPVADQQLAGVIMWIPASLVYLAAICWLFLRWIGEPGPQLPARPPAAAGKKRGPGRSHNHCLFCSRNSRGSGGGRGARRSGRQIDP